MSPVGIETTVSTSERPQTYALDRAATEIGIPYTGCFRRNSKYFRRW